MGRCGLVLAAVFAPKSRREAHPLHSLNRTAVQIGDLEGLVDTETIASQSEDAFPQLGYIADREPSLRIVAYRESRFSVGDLPRRVGEESRPLALVGGTLRVSREAIGNSQGKEDVSPQRAAALEEKRKPIETPPWLRLDRGEGLRGEGIRDLVDDACPEIPRFRLGIRKKT